MVGERQIDQAALF
jgi:hypothetical protein